MARHADLPTLCLDFALCGLSIGHWFAYASNVNCFRDFVQQETCKMPSSSHSHFYSSSFIIIFLIVWAALCLL